MDKVTQQSLDSNPDSLEHLPHTLASPLHSHLSAHRLGLREGYMVPIFKQASLCWEPPGKQGPARPLCVCRPRSLKGPLEGAGAAQIQRGPQRRRQPPDAPSGAQLAALTTRYRARAGPEVGHKSICPLPCGYLVWPQGQTARGLQGLPLSPTHLHLAPRLNLYHASSSCQAPGSFRSQLPDGGSVCPEAWPRPQLPAFVWQVLSVPSVTGWRECGKTFMLSLPSSAPQDPSIYVLSSTSTFNTRSLLGSESTPPSRTLRALTSTHSAAPKQSHHTPSTKNSSKTCPRQGWKIPHNTCQTPSLQGVACSKASRRLAASSPAQE